MPHDQQVGRTDDETKISEYVPCGAYTPGHEIHYIQANRAARDAAVSGTATVDADGWITIVTEGETSRKWHHDPARLARLLEANDGRVLVRTHGVLAIASTVDSEHFICIGSEPTPCPTDDGSHLDLHERAIERGGFLIAGDELV